MLNYITNILIIYYIIVKRVHIKQKTIYYNSVTTALDYSNGNDTIAYKQ